MIDHHKISSYHAQENGAIESFNKTFVKGLTKICNLHKIDWDNKILTVLCAYRATFKISFGQTTFNMVYGQEVVIPLQYKYQTPEITKVLKLELAKEKEERILQL